jgi:nucleoside-diphosphate-sugar epimerase
MARVLIAGCGYVGGALGRMLSAEGHQVWGLRRSATGKADGMRSVRADLTRSETLGGLPGGIEFVFYTAGAKSREEAAYRSTYLDGIGNLLRALREQGERPRRVFFTSSTAVYGQRRGEWVDEESVTMPTRFSGDILRLSEGLLLAGSFPATVLRLGGIYGPGRTSMIERVREGAARRRPGPPHFTNRIHRDDAAGALHHLMARVAEPENLYLGIDSEPADESQVLCWLADRLGLPHPPEGESSSRRGAGSKRCSNARLLAAGYRFRYPSFREGYEALLHQGV